MGMGGCRLRTCLDDLRRWRLGRLAPGRIFLPRLVEMPRLPDVFRLQDLGRRTQPDKLSGKEQGLREILPHELEVMKDGQNRASLRHP